jgi:Cu/Ag efflux protein CusF
MKKLRHLALGSLLALTGLLHPLAAQATTMTDAEVRKVDREAGKLTLKHGTIQHLDMPPMTMVFSVRDKSILAPLKVGDKVQVMIMDEKGKYTVTEIRPAP